MFNEVYEIIDVSLCIVDARLGKICCRNERIDAGRGM